jgi:ubiquinone/menaquinone biosynthesis C-methylase UbiE
LPLEEVVSDASRIASAYDAVAADYDRHLEADRWIRRALWRHYDRLFHPGDRVLDVGCGTGIDTLHLAAQGMEVTGVDASAAMVQRLRDKLGGTMLGSRVTIHGGDVVEVLRRLDRPFDGIVAAFAVLNTVDLPRFVPEAARLLRPGGRLVAHLLAPGHGARLIKKCWRVVRSAVQPVPLQVHIHGWRVEHALFGPRQLYRRFFAGPFAHRRTYALGLLVGPDLQRRLPDRVLDLVARVEARASVPWPLHSAGRFYVLDLERRPGGA